jgi:hypothetical protein
VLIRREFLSFAAALATLFSDRAKAVTPKAPRREVLTIGFGTAQMAVHPVPQVTTAELTIELESPAVAVRVGIANNTPTPYTLGGVRCCEAGPGPHPWTPLAGAPWSYIGFGGVGSPRGPVPVTVLGNRVAATGAANVPAITWSDWAEYRTVTPGRPKMLFRTLMPPQDMPMAHDPWPPHPERFLPSVPPRLRATREVPADLVTDPGLAAPASNHVVNSPLYVVQYRSVAPGLQIVVGGDSQVAQWFTFAQIVAMRLSTPALPLAVWGVAWPGMPSRTFWPILETAIEDARPSVTVIQGWTANDGLRPELWELYFQKLQESVGHARRVGGVPIVFTGMPRRLSANPALAQAWRQFNGALAPRLPGTAIFDLDQVVEDPARQGDWRTDYSQDGMHPNFAGSLAMADAFEPMVRPLL